jgi:hypothetical protein
MSNEIPAGGLVATGHAGSGGAMVMLALVGTTALVALGVSRRRR